METKQKPIEAHRQQKLSFVLITPARNEAAFIEETIKAVIAQTVLPLKWVIVSDGSTDETDEIVYSYCLKKPWIELVKMPKRAERHFAGKVHAFNSGYTKVKDIEHDIIGSLDADITFETDYFDFLLRKFLENPNLGVGGTPFRENGKTYDYRFSRKEHVSGACQLFRRRCFEDIGGYTPIKAGAIDLVAVVTARMKGWETETFPEKISIHHRRTSAAKYGILSAFFKDGYYDYPMGVHPAWELTRTVYNVFKKPLFIGGMTHMAGYFWAMVTRVPKPVSNEFVRFRRKEQIKWLKEYFRRFLPVARFN